MDPSNPCDALDKAAAGAKVEKARAFEIRASLRFGALDQPKTYYTVHVEKDGKARTLSVKPNGDLIKRLELPKKQQARSWIPDGEPVFPPFRGQPGDAPWMPGMPSDWIQVIPLNDEQLERLIENLQKEAGKK